MQERCAGRRGRVDAELRAPRVRLGLLGEGRVPKRRIFAAGIEASANPAVLFFPGREGAGVCCRRGAAKLKSGKLMGNCYAAVALGLQLLFCSLRQVSAERDGAGLT